MFSLLLFMIGLFLKPGNSLCVYAVVLVVEPVARIAIEAIMRWQHMSIAGFFKRLRISTASAISLSVGIVIGLFGAFVRSN